MIGPDGLAGKGDLERGQHSPGDGFAVEETLVAGGGFDGVAEGVAVVEDHAQAGFAFVDSDDAGFHPDRCGNDAFERSGIAGEDSCGILFHEAEERGIADDASFDGLEKAGAQLAVGEGLQDVDIGEDGSGVVEAADEVFACGEVDAGFAADGGVDLGEERGRNLDVVDAAHVDSGEEPSKVANNAAAESDEEGGAVGAGVG